MITEQLVEMLWCPSCQAAGLRPERRARRGEPLLDGTLICDGCGTSYPIHGGLPVLFPQSPLTSPDWGEWREHLEKFQARREERIERPDDIVIKVKRSHSGPQRAFATFTNIAQGTVLDVGCGPGKMRLDFDGSKVTYVGLDPIALPDVTDFPFVRGVAEYLPFRDGTFTDVIVKAALDHFRDIDRFVDEARRTLGRNGRLHILQSVHDVRGPVSAIKMLTHKVIDRLEERSPRVRAHAAPKHLSEFTRQSLLERIGDKFDVIKQERYSAVWYSPDKLFLSLSPR